MKRYTHVGLFVLTGICLVAAVALVGVPTYHYLRTSSMQVGNSLDGKAGMLGSWMSGVSATLLQVCVVLLLFKTYTLQYANERRQSFEDKFFKLLQRYEDAVRQLRYDDSQGRYVVFLDRKVYQDRHTFIVYQNMLLGIASEANYAEQLRNWFDNNDDAVGNWRRAVYQVVNHVENSEKNRLITGKDYMNILRGAMSRNEMQVLLLYLLTHEEPGSSETAKYLLRNDLFLYSNAKKAFGEHFEKINALMFSLHGAHIHERDEDSLTEN